MAFKIFRKNCCGLDVHKTWIYACIGITDADNRTEYKQLVSRHFQKDYRNFLPGLLNILVPKFVWSHPVNTGFLYSISLRKPAGSRLLIQNIRNLRRVTKQIVRMQSGFVIYLCVT